MTEKHCLWFEGSRSNANRSEEVFTAAPDCVSMYRNGIRLLYDYDQPLLLYNVGYVYVQHPFSRQRANISTSQVLANAA